MPWYAVYNEDTGALVSVGTKVDVDGLAGNLSFVEVDDFTPGEMTWDSDNLEFVESATNEDALLANVESLAMKAFAADWLNTKVQADVGISVGNKGTIGTWAAGKLTAAKTAATTWAATQ